MNFNIFFNFEGSSKPNYLSNNSRPSRIAEGMESNPAQRLKDLERLKALNGNVSSPNSSQSPITPKADAQLNQSIDLNKVPSLSRNTFSFSIGNSVSGGRGGNDVAKAKAAAILQKKPIGKSNPNFVKYRGTEAGKKRAHSALESEEESAQKKQKLAEEVEKFKNERIKQILSARSSHADLIEIHESNVQDQYFNKLEKKEAMEEKMLGTTKIHYISFFCHYFFHFSHLF